MMMEEHFFVNWYKNHSRDFPWRHQGTSPFLILVTEMLLRQTTAPAVAKIWYQFTQKYPDASALAGANRDELFDQLKILGLGLQRSTALQSISNWLVENYNGRVPDDLDTLLEAPHVGLYVAHAVLCFAFSQAVEIVDTNILRFYSRYYGLRTRPDIRRNPEVWQMAREALPARQADAPPHNYGLLDFTADICKSRTPACDICPLRSSCAWGTQ